MQRTGARMLRQKPRSRAVEVPTSGLQQWI